MYSWNNSLSDARFIRFLFSLNNSLTEHLYNVGSGEDIRIKDLAQLVQSIIGYQGELYWDRTKPDGTPRKLLDSNKLRMLGWNANTNLSQGIMEVYKWFLEEK